jgi:hypothetical protein
MAQDCAGHVQAELPTEPSSCVVPDRLGVGIAGALRCLLSLACDKDDAREVAWASITILKGQKLAISWRGRVRISLPMVSPLGIMAALFPFPKFLPRSIKL